MWNRAPFNPREVKGLCQVQVKLGAQIRLLYVDGSGEYFLAGNLIEAKSGRNLTMEATQLLNRLGAEDLRQLEALTAFTLGKGDKVLYFVTDPQCPYCKQAEAILKKIADKGELTVRFIFFPLPSHKGAKEQCISIICDKKGLEGLEKGYKSENQCADGVKKVDESLAFLQKKGIIFHPDVYFFRWNRQPRPDAGRGPAPATGPPSGCSQNGNQNSRSEQTRNY